jgi:hypothetical protein
MTRVAKEMAMTPSTPVPAGMVTVMEMVTATVMEMVTATGMGMATVMEMAMAT